MILTTAVIMGLILLILFGMLWIRKNQLDMVHRNFIGLKEQFGGEVLRGGFAVRPRYTGVIKGNKFAISITSEKNKNGRKYYIAATMESQSKVHFSILSSDWLEDREKIEEQGRKLVSIKNGQYLLELSKKSQLKQLNKSKLEEPLAEIDPVAYILVGKSHIILERPSVNLTEDTQIEPMRRLLNGMYSLKQAIE